MTKILTIPESVSINFEKYAIFLKGNSTQLVMEIPEGLSISGGNNKVSVGIIQEIDKPVSKYLRGLLGTFSSNLKNNMKGIHTGFNKQLNLVGVGYRAEKNKRGIILKNRIF